VLTLDEISQSDVLDYLRAIPDSSVQLIVADPPYNLGPKFGNHKEWINDNDWLPWCVEWLKECQRVLTPDGNLFVYGIHHYLCFIQVELYKLGMQYRRQIIWHYENGFSTYKRNLATHYEPLLWFSKTNDYYFDEIREPYKSQDRLKHKIIKNGKEWVPNPKGRIAGDVWSFPTLAGRRFSKEKVDHPTQKPLSISERLIKHFSEPGSTVLIPFAGSGSECVAAAINNRHFFASELNPEYANLANRRVREALEEIPLF
jgi:DNA modification methylase